MAATRSGRLRLLAATAALVTAWLATPHAVPLYDALGVPDEPYRYVTPPAGYQKTPPPSSVSVDFPAANGTNADAKLVQTEEQTSQAGVFIVNKSLVGPATTKTFKVTITAKAPDGNTPSGPVDGNVYQVEFWADSSPTATLNPADTSMVYIQRATTTKIAAADLLYRPAGGSWRQIADTKGGTDSFQGYFAGPGDYALVVATSPASSSSHTLVIVVLVLIVVAMVGAVVLIRLARRTASET